MDIEPLAELAAECDDRNDHTPLEPALIAAFGKVISAAEAWEILELDGLAGITIEGAYPPSVVTALIRRALELGDAEMLGIVNRLAYDSIDDILDVGAPSRQPVRGAVESVADELRQAWDVQRPELGVQIARALQAAEALESDDVDRLRLLMSSSSPDVVALAAFVDGIEPESSDPLVMLAAGRHSTAGGELARVVRSAIVAPRPLPSWWAFRTFEERATSEDIALTIAIESQGDVDPAVEKLLGREELEWNHIDRLHKMLFPEGVDWLGVLARDLSDVQIRFLARLGTATGLPSYGLTHAEDFPAFVAERGPFWSLRDVVVDGRPERWPAARIWKAHVWDVITLDEAVAALQEPWKPDELFALATSRWRLTMLQSPGRSRTDEHRGRDYALILAILDKIARDGGLRELVEHRVSNPRFLGQLGLGAAACMALALGELTLDHAGWITVAKAHEQLKYTKGFEAVVEAVPAESQAHLEATLDKLYAN